ncbi:type II toxin-antitoxin system VapC family toxin [Chlorogloeopsis sp. ULAP02]|uniref:type II toxin-antitoxin system VapC family toxin n=1 Tax=Chlorogloeopsis sp. ULAP02 TaxID=3107926 RepID=UPI003135CD6B
MEWLIPLQGQIIGLDTAPLIYFVEQNLTYLEMVRGFFQGVNQGDFQIVTSVLTLTEVLVHPLRLGNIEVARQYRDILFNQDNLITLPVSPAIAELAAQLRATQSLQTPDAIQIATAIQGGCAFFLTNDARLPAIPKVEI